MRLFAASAVLRAVAGAALLAAAATSVAAQGGADPALSRGDSAWTTGDRASARAAYQHVVDADSAASSRAVFRLATLLAWSNEFPSSLALFRLYVRLEPHDDAGRVALARTLAWSSRYDESIAIYDSIVSRDSSARDAVLGGAQALAWASRPGEAARRYRRWMDSHPDDVEAELAFAQTLARDGRLRESEATYARLAGEGAGVGAEKGLARTVAWEGSLDRSESLWRGLAARFPDDPEVWAGLAQVLRWRGRPGAAREALGRALAADPHYRDALSQLPWVEAELGSAIEPSIVASFDRDRNYSTLMSVRATIAAAHAVGLQLIASRRDASLGERYSSATLARGTATSVRIAAGRPLGDRLTVRAEAGASMLAPESGDAGSSVRGRAVTIGAWTARAALRPTSASGVGIAASRTPFDETASLIERGIAIQSLDGDADIALPLRLAVSASASHASIQGGSVSNDRDAFSGAVRWRARRELLLGVSARTMGYRTDGRPDAYFSPARFTLVELTTGWALGRELGWWGTLDGGAGPQAIRFHSVEHGERGIASRKLAERVSIGAGYRFSPGLEVGVSAGGANVASPTAIGVAEYRAYVLGIRARLTL